MDARPRMPSSLPDCPTLEDFYVWIFSGGHLWEKRCIEYILIKGNGEIRTNEDYPQHEAENNELNFLHSASVLINMDDVFWPAADSESIDSKRDLENLIVMMMLYGPNDGELKWAAHKRGLRPVQRVVDRMKRMKHWDAELEALPTYRDKWPTND